MLSLLLSAGALALGATTALAHQDPPGCFQSGPALVISVLDRDGATGLVGAASECETINYRVTLRKAFNNDQVCAFSGGSVTFTTPDGVVHDVSMDVPCIGGTTGPCDPSVDSVSSELIPYTLRAADVTGGFVFALATYSGGVSHDSDGVAGDTPGVGATVPKATPVVLCDDGDGCTQNLCDPSAHGSAACTNPPIDCNDDNACTTDGCAEGACTHVAPDPTCVPCEGAGDCNDHDGCTTDACTGGICVHTTPDPNCVPCQDPEDCNDGNACTSDSCTAGFICAHTTPDPTCVPCQGPGGCNDGNACTTDACTGGICTHATPDPTCVPCDGVSDCNDHNACTTDACAEGICTHATPDPTCVPCAGPGDCNDHNACTTDACTAGVCGHTAIAGCTPCETAAQCDDANTCTTDACTAGACSHQAIAGCGPENCSNGVDDDGDGKIDCADPDCAQDPVCHTEICGNCIDDDGDGKVDYEDDDCCDQTSSMVLDKMAVQTHARAGRNRLSIGALYSPKVSPGFDPGIQGTTLQLRDAQGTFFCQNIPFKSDLKWKMMGIFMFKDRTGLMAAGLRKAHFKVLKHRGERVIFGTQGKQMHFRDPVSSNVLVTLRVGNQCTQATAALKTRHAKGGGKKLVYP